MRRAFGPGPGQGTRPPRAPRIKAPSLSSTRTDGWVIAQWMGAGVNLSGKVALVTGASRGYRQRIAEALVQRVRLPNWRSRGRGGGHFDSIIRSTPSPRCGRRRRSNRWSRQSWINSPSMSSSATRAPHPATWPIADPDVGRDDANQPPRCVPLHRACCPAPFRKDGRTFTWRSTWSGGAHRHHSGRGTGDARACSEVAS